ncbi:Uncharacterised protein [Mycobacteroides abscessus]|nr:Uncharacterised protein [Mycobacteroides abscessus]
MAATIRSRCSGRWLETPIERARPASRISTSFAHAFVYWFCSGAGQCVRYRSTWSRPSLSRLSRIASCGCSPDWRSFQSFVVTKSSSRGMPLFAMAAPTPSSLR